MAAMLDGRTSLEPQDSHGIATGFAATPKRSIEASESAQTAEAVQVDAGVSDPWTLTCACGAVPSPTGI